MSQKFIDVGSYQINADRILYVKESEIEGECVVVLDAGEPLRLNNKDSLTLRYRLIMLRHPRPYVSHVSGESHQKPSRIPRRMKLTG